MSRSQIDRLTRRIEALEGERKSRAQRVFTVLVRNHMRRDEEVARFRAEHGVTGDDLLIAQVIVPFQTLAHETAAAAYQRELRDMAGNDRNGRKRQEVLPDHGERSALERRRAIATDYASGGDRRVMGGKDSRSSLDSGSSQDAADGLPRTSQRSSRRD
jgi:hypothetical protein